MDKIFHTPITVITICKNGSEKFGATATSNYSTSLDKKFFEVNMHGKTKDEAKSKLINFLSDGGNLPIEEVQNG